MTQHSKPDDLKLIKGLGPGIERQLHKAGIDSIESLAKQLPETLIKQIGRPTIKPTVMQGWIQDAQRLTAARNKKSIVRDSPATSSQQRYANFTLEILLDKANRVRRTRMVHVQSGEKSQWTSWDIRRLVGFITDNAHAKLPPLPKATMDRAITKTPFPPQVAEVAAPVRRAENAQESLQVQSQDSDSQLFSTAITQIKLDPRASQLLLHCVLQLVGPGASAITTQQPKFVIEVLGLNLFTSQVIVLGSCEGALQANQFEYPISVNIPLPNVGRYQLETIALLPDQDAIAVQLGPILTAIP